MSPTNHHRHHHQVYPSPSFRTSGACAGTRRPITPSPPNTHPLLLIHSSSSTSQDVAERLDRLHATISAVLKGYSSLSNPSPIYLDSLNMFHERAKALIAISVVQQQQKEVKAEQEIGKRYTHKSPSRHHHHHHASPPSLTMTPHISPPAQEPSNLLGEIEQLESDWWNSEIASTWFGPRPNLTPSRSQYSYDNFSKRRTSATTLNSFVSASSEGRGSSIGFGAIRRMDASYVGLNDE
nr:uncharacterized protein CI109_006062 [Kwoniella shandongensis]KAA5525611.1 hypothetical protein CI109_006062 [Kwoniella shandongensis]